MLITLAAAGVALYLTVCLLFYQGQWQFAFFPPKTKPNAAPLIAASRAAASGLPVRDVQFDYTEEGIAQLDGWWVPAEGSDRITSPASTRPVVLFCHSGTTDMRENIALLHALHGLGVAVFAFDYRGFGGSQHVHPSQQKAYADGDAALRYLTGTRHIDVKRIVLYGSELGSAVAAHVAQQSPHLAGLVLEDAQPSLVAQVKREQHIHALPLWLIFQDRFDIAGIVPELKMPKLFFITPDKRLSAAEIASAAKLAKDSPMPKKIVHVDSSAASPIYTQPAWRQDLLGFMDEVTGQSRPDL